MKNKTSNQRTHESTVKALKRARILKELTRKQLAEKLNVSFKAIEQVENGRNKLSDIRIKKYLEALEISQEQFLKIKRSKKITHTVRFKKVTELSERRSYRKILLKEVKVLKTLRKIKNYSQDEASKICGYSRPTIGHIENGRITLSEIRIEHIVRSLGFNIETFEYYMKSEELRDEILDCCMKKINLLSDDKIFLVKGIIDSMSG